MPVRGIENSTDTVAHQLFGSSGIPVVAALSGCVMRSGIDNDFSFKDSDKSGVAAFSVQCFGSPEQTMLTYSGKGIDSDIIQRDEINFECTDNYPQYFAIKLPAGQYNFDDMQQDSPWSSYSPDFRTIDFSVSPGRVTYIGRILIGIGINNTLNKYGIALVNRAEQDIPMFKLKYKNIPSARYTTKIAKFRKKKHSN